MLKAFVLWLINLICFYLLFDQIAAVEVVTQAGKILGMAIWAIVATALQMLFVSGKLVKYRFSMTLLVLSFASAMIIKFLPGYTVKDLNMLLFINILATFVSVIAAVVIGKKSAINNVNNIKKTNKKT